jgi:hypothetical protein
VQLTKANLQCCGKNIEPAIHSVMARVPSQPTCCEFRFVLVACYRKADALLPDGRIFGQITQKRPQKIVHSRKKLEAVKLQN